MRLDLSELPDDLMVQVDQGQFMQIFKNLFQNAIDAMSGNPGSIRVRAFSIDRMGAPVIRLQIQDEGSGIAPENLKDIFAPYYTTKKTGSGLGLAIVEKIILDHGGRIWVESQPGSGSSFFIDLPRVDRKPLAGGST
jgi:two-component system nitrogen regulation sensor histidine kinase NtrY